jgi:protein-S-isoprenylcysteine O-methyltransferase Ste14
VTEASVPNPPPDLNPQARTRERPSLERRAFWRWLTIAVIMSVLLVMYTQHPYYRRPMFAPWKPVFQFGFYAWLILGLPYAYATVKRFSTPLKDLRDPTLHWMLLFRAAWNGKISHIVKNRRVKVSMLSLIVKAFFAPLMTSFFSGHANNIARNWAFRKGLPPFGDGNRVLGLGDWWAYVTTTVPKMLPNWSDVSALFHSSWYTVHNIRFATDLYYDIIFFTDCGWALMGYCLESQWFNNKTKSVEPTMLGWAAAIFCYPPFNDILGTYLPLDQSNALIRSPQGLLACRILMLAAFTIYVWATLAFGMKFSNLTNRGIITRGPYAWFRHPAYVCKGFAWWMEYLPNMGFQTAVFLIGLNGVYALRAWTEERHLSMDPDYVAYKKKVPWVLIPGVY